jgi:hypothetical protein
LERRLRLHALATPGSCQHREYHRGSANRDQGAKGCNVRFQQLFDLPEDEQARFTESSHLRAWGAPRPGFRGSWLPTESCCRRFHSPILGQIDHSAVCAVPLWKSAYIFSVDGTAATERPIHLHDVDWAWGTLVVRGRNRSSDQLNRPGLVGERIRRVST